MFSYRIVDVSFPCLLILFALGCGCPTSVDLSARGSALQSLKRGEVRTCWVTIHLDNDRDGKVTTWYEITERNVLEDLENRLEYAKRATGGVKFSFGTMRVEWSDNSSHTFTMCPENIFDDVSQCYGTVNTTPLRQFLKQRKSFSSQKSAAQ